MTPEIIGTLTFPCTQPLYGGRIGPYERTAGDWAYSIVCEIASSVASTNIVAYKTPAQPDPNYGKIWTRVAAGPTTPNGKASVFRFNSSDDVLNIGYQDRSTFTLQALTFDMTTETFSSPDPTGSGAISSPNIVMLIKLSSGDLVFFYDDSSNSVSALVKTSGVWGTAITIDAGPNVRFAGALRVTDSNLKVLVDHFSGAGFHPVIDFTCYTFDGSAVTGSSVAFTVSGTDTADFRVGAGVYDVGGDLVAWPIVNVVNSSDNNQIFLLTGQASVVAPVFSQILVYDDPDFGDSIGPPVQVVPITGGFNVVFDLVPSDASPERIYTCFCAALDGTWDAPVLFYDLAAGPPSPPPHNDVIFPVFAIESPDGTPFVTMGLTQTIETLNFCGVLYSLPVAGPVCGDPIQVSDDAQFRPSASEINPYYFSVGTDLYQVLVASQGEAKLGVFKRAKTSISGAWAEQDSASSPNNTAQSGFYNVVKNGTKLAILYLLDDLVSLKIVEFDTATDTYGAPTAALTIPTSAGSFCFFLRGSTYTVIGAGTDTYAVTNTGGTWSSITTLFGAPAAALYGGALSVFGNFYFIYVQVSAHLELASLSPSLGFTHIHTITNNLEIFFNPAARPTLVFSASDTLQIGYINTFGGEGFVVTTVTNVHTSPGFTNTSPTGATSIDEHLSYATVVLGVGGALTAFYVRRNIVSMPVVNQVERSSFSAGTWSTPVVYYDAVADPPAGGTSDTSQVIRALQPIQFGSGWSLALTMNTFVDPDTFQTGFYIDACGAGQTLQLTKTVSGGTGVPAMWLLSAAGPTPISGAGDTGALPVDPGTYDLTESVGPDGYTAGAWDCGDAEMPTASSVVVPEGEDVVCEIINSAGTPPFRASCPSPIYVVGTPYSSFVTVVGGVPPYTFTLLSGSLPTGLSLNASTGELSGTPSADGPFSFVIRVTDDNGDHADTTNCSAGRCPGTRSII